MTSPLVSIVVPTRDGAATLPRLLDGLASQRVDFPFETIAIDSGSRDGTVDVLERRVDRLLRIDPASFNHGATRNAGVEAARGELIVLTVQDAAPANERWLDALTAPLRVDSDLAGTFARQEPHPDADALTRHYLSRWVAANEEPRILSVRDRTTFDTQAPMDRFLQCAFDNVCSCIRRSVWQRHPFRPTPIAEDVGWARDVLLAGHRLAYVPEAVIVHSHQRPAREEFQRTRTLHRELARMFDLRTIPTAPALIRAIGSCCVTHMRCRDHGRPSLGRALALAVAWPLGQYLGGRRG